LIFLKNILICDQKSSFLDKGECVRTDGYPVKSDRLSQRSDVFMVNLLFSATKAINRFFYRGFSTYLPLERMTIMVDVPYVYDDEFYFWLTSHPDVVRVIGDEEEVRGYPFSTEEIEMNEEYQNAEDCVANHPYAIRSEENRREEERRAAAALNGRMYKDIQFREGVRRHAITADSMCEMLRENPGLQHICAENTSCEYRLTVGTCALLPSLVEDDFHGHPLWVIHLPDIPRDFIDGCCFFFGISENRMNAYRYDNDESLAGTYLYWDFGKRYKIQALASKIIESLKEADDKAGSIAIAYVCEDGCLVQSDWIPDGLVDWILKPEIASEKPSLIEGHSHSIAEGNHVLSVRYADESTLV
jgi:hypothetical protein